eukprot:14936233-Heterocapsa_arctica.AAC.1
MGSTCVFWFIQRLHVFMITQCGVPPRNIITGDWPPPPVGVEPITLPYCDNVTVMSTSRDAAVAMRDRI